jgi:two-component system, NtrC family, response regulator HydG
MAEGHDNPLSTNGALTATMGPAKATILVIDDRESVREGLEERLTRLGHTVFTAASGKQGVELYDRQAESKQPIELTVTDLKMEGIDGIGVVKSLRARNPLAVIIVMTAHGSIDLAVQAMREGAFDFFEKVDTELKREVIEFRVNRALAHMAAQRREKKLQQAQQQLIDESAPRAKVPSFEMIGSSPRMLEIIDTIKKVARSDSSVLVSGDSGTGKELVARAIHQNSARATGPFVPTHCGALADTLLESELFGHEKGSFTGAARQRLGRFELADGGTLFLDEIGEISHSTQVKLLRVLQERTFERVGGEETVRVDVRVIAATNRDLRDEVRQGRFREDLFYRLNVVEIVVPPLRERREDIPAIAHHFLTKLAARTRRDVKGFSADAIAYLSAYPWPGNIRELENAVEQAMIFAEGDRLTAADLPPQVRAAVGELNLPMPGPTPPPAPLAPSSTPAPGAASALAAHTRPASDAGATPSSASNGAGANGSSTPGAPAGGIAPPGSAEHTPLDQVLENIERQLILQAYEKARGVKTETARLLGLKTSALYYKLEKYGII